MADYAEMLERDARGNPPELQAKLDAGHERFLAMVRDFREAKNRGSQHAGHSGPGASRAITRQAAYGTN
jgi:hypothetical protein